MSGWRLEGAGDGGRRSGIVLEPVEHGGAGAAPGAIEFGAARIGPERIVDANGEVGISAAEIRSCPFGMYAGDPLARLAGECARQSGDVRHRPRGSLRVRRRLNPLNRCRERFDPRAEHGRENPAEITEPLLDERVSEEAVGGRKERPNRRMRAGGRLLAWRVARCAHRSAPELIDPGPGGSRREGAPRMPCRSEAQPR